MTHSAPSEKVLVVDAGHGVGPLLAALLTDAGLEVSAWLTDVNAPPVDLPPAVRSLRVDAVEGLDADLIEATDAVIFNSSALDEEKLLADGALADAVQADARFFMATLQIFAKAMIEKGRGQIWVLGLDDSFAYYIPLPITPIIQHARIGAVRALAKEIARFGVSANAIIMQPAPEDAEPAAWQAARAGLASYAQRFKPVTLAETADTLAFWLRRKRLPMNGSVLHFGNGVYDGNA